MIDYKMVWLWQLAVDFERKTDWHFVIIIMKLEFSFVPLNIQYKSLNHIFFSGDLLSLDVPKEVFENSREFPESNFRSPEKGE